jgi:hypothetical protein
VNNKGNLEVLAEELARLGPVLPGSISEQYSVCGKKNCRCSAKLNPQKHGPRYQLSYTLGGKSSSMFIKQNDVEAVYNMTASYRRMRLLSTELALESIKLSRDVGPSEAQKRIQTTLDKTRCKAIGAKPEPARYRDLEQSRGKWKECSIKRGDMLEQNRIRFRDLEQSREKWRNEALSLRQTMVWQEKKLEENKKELIAVKKELRNLTENHVKKN